MNTKRQRKLLRRAEKQGRRESRLENRHEHPTKTDAEVFMSKNTTYHEHFCTAMNGVWLSGSNRIRVIPRAEVGGAFPCSLCQQITTKLAAAARLDSLDARYA